MSFFTPRYFQVYPDDQEMYSGLSAAATFICGITTNVITAVILGCFESSVMAKPYLCIFKALGDIPFLALIFLQ